MKITKDMGITDTVRQYPETIEVFMRFGMGCIGCAAASFENIEEGAMVHGIDPDELIQKLNEALE